MNDIRQWLHRAYCYLYVQLCTYQIRGIPAMPVYLPDDATEDELTELAMEQREIATTEDRSDPMAFAIRYGSQDNS